MQAAENQTPEDLLADFVYEQECGNEPRYEEYEDRLGDEESRREFRELHAALVESERLMPVHLRAATVLGGRYRLLRELGIGGFGKVWLAADERLADRPVAVKVLHGLSGSSTRADLLREKETLARTDHPGIVQILDVGEHDENPFLVMRFVEGRTLSRALAELARTTPERTPPDAEHILAAFGITDPDDELRETVRAGGWFRFAARIQRQFVDALAAAHASRVAHADIKPSNVMIERTGRVVLLDFGVARVVDDKKGLTRSGLTGTLAYMAPEQLGPDAERFAFHTDVFQAGRVLYELMTLRPAVAPDLPPGEMFDEVRAADATPPLRRMPAAPSTLGRICLKATEADPERRYEEARAFREDLDDFLAGTPPRHLRTGTIHELDRALRRTVRRNPRTVWIGAAALAVVLGSALGRWTAAGSVAADGPTVLEGDVVRSRLDVREEGLLFGFVQILDDALDVELRRIPLVAEKRPVDPPVANPVAPGIVDEEMFLPAAVRLDRQELERQGARLDIRFKVCSGDEAERMRSIFEAAVARISEAGLGFDSGLPLDEFQRIAAARSRGADGGSIDVDALLEGEGWASAGPGDGR